MRQCSCVAQQTTSWNWQMWLQRAQLASLCCIAVVNNAIALYTAGGIRGTIGLGSSQLVRIHSTPWQSSTNPCSMHWAWQITRRSSSSSWATGSSRIMGMTLRPTGGASLRTGHGAFVGASNQSSPFRRAGGQPSALTHTFRSTTAWGECS